MKLNRCKRAPYGAPAILGINRANKGGDKEAKQGQGQRVADEVKKYEPAANSSHVPNEARQIALAKMMAKVHGESYIGKRQRVGQCVRLKDWN
jgi:hypothetical protein